MYAKTIARSRGAALRHRHAAINSANKPVADGSQAGETMSQPFTRVDFYVDNAFATAPATASNFLVLIGSSSGPSLNDDGTAQGRKFSYSFTWTPGANFGCAVANIPIYAVGVNAAGDALVTLVNTNISITNP